MLEIIVALMIYNVVAPTPPQPGTYQMAADSNGTLIRMDTRTGAAERCVLNGTALSCLPIVAKQ